MGFIDKKYDDCKESVFPSAYDFNDDNYMQDLATEDWQNVKDYENALNSGDTVSANRAYNNIENADRKIFSASRWNKLRDAIKSTQKYFIEEINGLITSLEEKISNILKKKGEYNSSTTYYCGDIVTYNIDDDIFSYMCTVNNTINITPTNTNNWTCVSIKGDPGEYYPKGVYNNATTYNKYDCVLYNGVNYVAVEDNIIGIVPSDDSSKWKVFLDGVNAITLNGKSAEDFANVNHKHDNSYLSLDGGTIGADDGTLKILPMGIIGDNDTTIEKIANITTANLDVSNSIQTDDLTAKGNTHLYGLEVDDAVTFHSDLDMDNVNIYNVARLNGKSIGDIISKNESDFLKTVVRNTWNNTYTNSYASAGESHIEIRLANVVDINKCIVTSFYFTGMSAEKIIPPPYFKTDGVNYFVCFDIIDINGDTDNPGDIKYNIIELY